MARRRPRQQPAQGRPFARTALGLAPLAWAGALSIAGGPSWATGTARPVTGSIPACAVQISVGATSASATVLSGCQGSDYWFSSWQTQAATYQPGAPQQLLDATDHAPWTVALPTGSSCYYQLDFSERQTAPGHSGSSPIRVASLSGETPACSSGTTTTAPTSTSSSSSTTTALPTTTVIVTTTSSTTTSPPPTTTTISPPTSVSLSLPTTPPTVATASGSGTTSTTSAVSLGAGQGGTPQAPPASGSPVPASASLGRSGFGSLAFTGFALLMSVFIAAVLIAAGLGMVRAARRSRVSPGPR